MRNTRLGLVLAVAFLCPGSRADLPVERWWAVRPFLNVTETRVNPAGTYAVTFDPYWVTLFRCSDSLPIKTYRDAASSADIFDIQFSGDGKTLWHLRVDVENRLENRTLTGALLRTIPLAFKARKLAVSPNGQLALLYGEPGHPNRLISLATGAVQSTFDGFWGFAEFSRDSKRFLADVSGFGEVFNTSGVQMGGRPWQDGIALSSDGKTMYRTSVNVLEAIDVDTDANLSTNLMGDSVRLVPNGSGQKIYLRLFDEGTRYLVPMNRDTGFIGSPVIAPPHEYSASTDNEMVLVTPSHFDGSFLLYAPDCSIASYLATPTTEIRGLRFLTDTLGPAALSAGGWLSVQRASDGAMKYAHLDSSWVWGPVASPTGNRMLLGVVNGSIALTDQSGSPIWSQSIFVGADVAFAGFLNATTAVAVSMGGEVVKIRTEPTYEVLYRNKLFTGADAGIVLKPTLAACHVPWENSLQLFNPVSGTLIGSVPLKGTAAPTLAAMEGGATLAVAEDNSVRSWDVSSPTPALWSIKKEYLVANSNLHLASSRNGKELCVLGFDGSAWIFVAGQTSTAATVFLTGVGDKPVVGDYSPDGKRMAIGYNETGVRVIANPLFPFPLLAAKALPATVVAGTPAKVQIELEGPALPTGASISLSSNSPRLKVPSKVTIGSGKVRGAFLFATTRGPAANVQVSATYRGKTIKVSISLTASPARNAP